MDSSRIQQHMLEETRNRAQVIVQGTEGNDSKDVSQSYTHGCPSQTMVWQNEALLHVRRAQGLETHPYVQIT
jgi:hypothetical protein